MGCLMSAENVPLAFAPALCRYGQSPLAFRGPAVDLSQPYLALLGGSESFGPGQAQPFAALWGEGAGLPVLNLAQPQAGPDLYLKDPALLPLAAGAEAAVVQLPGLTHLSNPYYRVHPRRNDRVVAVSEGLRQLYEEVDFSEIAFTEHLVTTLKAADPDRFSFVADALRMAWVEAMRALLAPLSGKATLLWLLSPGAEETALPLTADVVEELTPAALGRVDLVLDLGADLAADPDFNPLRATRPPLGARELGPASHARIAARLLADLPAPRVRRQSRAARRAS